MHEAHDSSQKRTRISVYRAKNSFTTNDRDSKGAKYRKQLKIVMAKDKKKAKNTRETSAQKVLVTEKPELRNIQTAEPARARNAWLVFHKEKMQQKLAFEEREQKIAENMRKLEKQYGIIK